MRAPLEQVEQVNASDDASEKKDNRSFIVRGEGKWKSAMRSNVAYVHARDAQKERGFMWTMHTSMH